jgi:nucleoside-triphosphatase THEP1
LIVDEIGPLELLRGEGWIEAMSVLRANDYRLAVVVVRPALVTLFLKSLDGREPLLLSITSFNRDALPGQVLALLESDE